MRPTAVALLACCACGVSGAPTSFGRERQPIVGGATDMGDPQVFFLYLEFFDQPDGGGNRLLAAGCSGTLIAPHTLLTAAHCVGDRTSSPGVPAGTQSLVIHVTDVYDESLATPPQTYAVTYKEFNPQWDPASHTGDLGLALLGGAPSASIKPVNMTDLSALGGAPIRVIGYGENGGGPSSSGIRREVDLTLFNVQSDRFELGNGDAGICFGDSGGPSVHTFADGIERVVGVHSYTNSSACTDGEDIRVDWGWSWIQSWINTRDPLPCAAGDGLCTSGCAPPDPDCVPVGQPCASAAQCDSRDCVSDPQHPATYCTQACGAQGACPTNMGCDGGVCFFTSAAAIDPGQPCTVGSTPCATGAICTGPSGGMTACLAPCATDANCPTNWQCVPGTNGSYCQVAPPPLDAGTGGAVVHNKGCSSTGGAPLLVLLLLVVMKFSAGVESSGRFLRRTV